MSHIKSLIDNLINQRSKEAALDLHNHVKATMRSQLAVKEADRPFVPALLWWHKKNLLSSEIAGQVIHEMSYSNDIRPRDPELVQKALDHNDPQSSHLVIMGFYSESDAKGWLADTLQRLRERDDEIPDDYRGIGIETDFDE